jgi:hypothetical protein
MIAIMNRRARVAVTAALAAGLAAACGSSASDAAIKSDLIRGVAQIRRSHDPKTLRGQLVRTIAKLRREHPATAKDRRAKRLAVRGFAATLKGVDSRIAFTENDSGNIAAATRDALRADRYLTRGANLLSEAGEALHIRITGLREP